MPQRQSGVFHGRLRRPGRPGYLPQRGRESQPRGFRSGIGGQMCACAGLPRSDGWCNSLSVFIQFWAVLHVADSVHGSGILGYQGVTVCSSKLPNSFVQCVIQGMCLNMGRVWIIICQLCYQTRREVLVEQQLHAATAIWCLSRSAA